MQSNDNPRANPVEVRAIEIHRTDARIAGKLHNTASKVGGGVRSSITKFSDASRRRLIFAARNLIAFFGFLTLTYPHEQYSQTATGGDFMRDGKAVKRHQRRLREWL